MPTPSSIPIRNVAIIQFDFGIEIATHQADPLDPDSVSPDLEALITLDGAPPESAVQALHPVSSRRFTVSWGGTDDAAGIREYDIYVARENGPYILWLAGTRETSAEFTTTEPGVRYRFF